MKSPVFSCRSEEMIDSPIRRLSKYAQDAKRKGIFIYSLNIGQPDIPTHPSFLKAIEQEHPAVVSYTLSEGTADLRREVAHYYNTHFHTTIEAEHILTTCGSSEALLFTLFACADQGDEIIVPEPCYTNYLGYAHITHVKVKAVGENSTIDNQFKLPSIEAFHRQISPKTKAILICNPNNPTGYVYTREELFAIADMCIKHNLFLIVDEAYRELTYDTAATSALDVLQHIKDRLIVLDTVSKKYSACGARVGFVITYNKEALEKMLKLGHMRLAPPLLEQIGSKALFQLPTTYYEEVRSIYRRRRDLFVNGLQQIKGIDCYSPNGAFYVCCRLPVEDAADFCEWMLRSFTVENKTVMMTPLNGFYQDKTRGKNEVRLAYVLNEDDLLGALNVIKEGLHAYMNR